MQFVDFIMQNIQGGFVSRVTFDSSFVFDKRFAIDTLKLLNFIDDNEFFTKAGLLAYKEAQTKSL